MNTKEREIIYSAGPSLGDNWYVLNKVLRLRQGDEEPIYISYYDRPERAKRLNSIERLKELKALLNAEGVERIQFVDKKPMTFKTGFIDTPWDVEYFPTYLRWKKEKAEAKVICYQFDGNWARKNKGLPSQKLLLNLFRELDNEGYRLVYLGYPFPLSVIVKYLATCRCFVGVNSGISHLAHSVGVKKCLIESGGVGVGAHHVGKEYTVAKIVKEVLKFVEDVGLLVKL